MKAKIYRGTKEIGGTCVELIADNGKILWIDIGSPLSNKNPNIDYVKNKVDAVLISHPHQDHYGLLESIVDEVPIYIGELSLDLINATRIFIGKNPFIRSFEKILAWKRFTIAGTFHITPYLVDHSTPEAFAFLIEADGIKVFYSGDFRSTGRKKIVYERFIENPPNNIDYLFIEGTMVERVNHLYADEESIENALLEIFSLQKNASFVVSSGQNIDRFVSVFRACLKSRKYLVIDIYGAWILELVRKKSKNTPAIEWEEIKVFEHPSQLEKIKDKSFEDFRQRIKNQSVGNSIFHNPSDYVHFVRCPNVKLVNKLKGNGVINIIYSQWEGYLLNEHKNYCTDNLNKLRVDKDISFHLIHSSGHATLCDLLEFSKAISPHTIIPIHTEFPDTFKREFENEGITNINLWDDGTEYQLKKNIL